MKLLLDTHVFLWYIAGDAKLPSRFKVAIADPANEVYLSAASVWEAVIKYRLGKLALPSPPATYMPTQREAHRISGLPIDENAMASLASLPGLHRDPFDRLLVAQAIQHGLTIITVDPEVSAYGAPSLPAV
ncbi:MAG: domain nuclease [Phycisphaerales bacterium]|nr:domain nuclease [Phycisphaerales bacterium]